MFFSCFGARENYFLKIKQNLKELFDFLKIFFSVFEIIKAERQIKDVFAKTT